MNPFYFTYSTVPTVPFIRKEYRVYMYFISQVLYLCWPRGDPGKEVPDDLVGDPASLQKGVASCLQKSGGPEDWRLYGVIRGERQEITPLLGNKHKIRPKKCNGTDDHSPHSREDTGRQPGETSRAPEIRPWDGWHRSLRSARRGQDRSNEVPALAHVSTLLHAGCGAS